MKERQKKRVVVKIGTSILTTSKGLFSPKEVERMAHEVLPLVQGGHQVILVSSGAIACGMDTLHLKERPDELPLLQACAAIGQGKLMGIYEGFFARSGIHTAQVLLTREALDSHERFLNARNTLLSLFRLGVLTIVNENDTIATEEIRFGDNDSLSSLVACMVDADLLVMLTDVDGFLKKDSTLVETVSSPREIDTLLKEHLRPTRAGKTVGGMSTKLEAARFAVQSGIPVVLGNGRRNGVMKKVIGGERVGTHFLPSPGRRGVRKSWMVFSRPQGELVIDEGAEEAIVKKGRSLLPSGILEVAGPFPIGTLVHIKGRSGREVGRGLTYYSSQDIERIRGKKTQEIENVLGFHDYDEVIHRDHMILEK